MKILAITLSLILLMSCSKQNLNEQTALKFSDAIADRKSPEDIRKFLSSNFEYEDVILKQIYSNPTEFAESYNFQDSAFHFSRDKYLTITDKTTSEDGKVWLKGTIYPYRYAQNEVAEMRFVWILNFDEEGYISKLENWQDHSIKEIINVYQFRQQN